MWNVLHVLHIPYNLSPEPQLQPQPQTQPPNLLSPDVSHYCFPEDGRRVRVAKEANSPQINEKASWALYITYIAEVVETRYYITNEINSSLGLRSRPQIHS
ncbi:hypothetical protein HPP92_023630 [Vanilla planifolia]|uniref:Uncharacterized protein n=1 Tax=Vanilla planifolia TaxID=51239 RepID=A0A835PT67_VANPL|nr:hypothetical protein HPP92_023630 [Vanilla planifolia]